MDMHKWNPVTQGYYPNHPAGLKYELLHVVTHEIVRDETNLWSHFVSHPLRYLWRFDQKQLKRMSEVLNILQPGDYVHVVGSSGRNKWRKVILIDNDKIISYLARNPDRDLIPRLTIENCIANINCIVRNGNLVYGKAPRGTRLKPLS